MSRDVDDERDVPAEALPTGEDEDFLFDDDREPGVADDEPPGADELGLTPPD